MIKRLLLILSLLIASPAWAGRTLVQSDNFDDNTLSAGSVLWTQLNSANAVMGNAGGLVLCNHSPECSIRADGTYSNDQYAKLTVTTLPAAGSQAIGLLCRASADTGAGRDFYRASFTGANPKVTTIAKVVNGTNSNLATSSALTWNTNDTIEFECIGTDLTIFKNGVSTGLTVSDAAIASGKPGIAITNQIPRGDNWEGGDATAAPPGTSFVRHRVIQQ